VELIKGWFKDTLEDFLETRPPEEPIALLHLDCDLYSLASTALQTFAKRVKPGTIILFDEFYNYPGAENHEFKAFMEFLRSAGLKARYLAYNTFQEQVAVQVY
jgi:hypothetical protein